MGDPLNVTCGVCQDVCKRAVRVSCCKERACRNCAVKYISKHRTCWDSDCTTTLSTNDVVNDEELREFIESLEDPGPINCTICGEICKRGAVSSCCKAPCCRSCGVKKVTVDTKCWMEDCGSTDLECDDLENDDVLRDAVVHYMNTGILDPGHLHILNGRREKKEVEDKKSTQPKLVKKRKSFEEEERVDVKKTKLSPKPPMVYLELNMIHEPNKGPQILQIGLWSQYSIPGFTKLGKLSLFQSIACPALKNIKSGSTLNAVGLHKEGEKLYFKGKNGKDLKELECKSEKKSLQDASDFLRDVKSKSDGSPIILATYRNVTIVHFLNAFKRHLNIKNLETILAGVVSLEDVLEQNDIVDWLPMKSMTDLCINFVNNKFASQTKRGCSPNILAQAIAKMAEKYNFNLTDHTKPVQEILSSNLTSLDLSIPLESNTYAIENSSNFDMIEPIVDVDEKKEVDQIVEVSHRSLCFPIHSQPILAELKNADENVKFVKLKLSIKLPNTLIVKNKTNAFKVYRHEGKSYIIPYIFPTQELPYKVSSHRVQHLEDFKVRSVLGEYTACEGTDLPLLTNKLVKLIVTKTGEKENIYIGPEPTVIVVTLTNLPSNAEVTPDHAFVMGSSSVAGIEILSRFFGVRQASKTSARARIVVCAKESVGKWVLRNGQQIGTAALVSEWTTSRVVQEAQKFENICWTIQGDFEELQGDQDYPMVDEGMGYQDEDIGYHDPVVKEYEEKFKEQEVDTVDTETNACNTVASTRLYAQGSNPVLVKLEVKGSPKFNVIHMEYSSAFKKLVQAEDGGRFSNKFKTKVLWVNENKVGKKGGKSSMTVPVPYAFVDIRLGKKKSNQYVDYIDLPENFALVTYTLTTYANEDEVDLSMNVCIDFNAKNVILDGEPKLVEVYLKFRDTEIDKKKAMEQIFYIEECNNARVEILSLVFKPQQGSRLAPQKTSTNDMKAGLIMKATHPGDVVPLTGRQVIAVAKVASSNVDLAGMCAVSGSGFVCAQPEDTYDEEFGDLSYTEPGFQDGYGGYGRERAGLPEDELIDMSLMRMRRQKYDLGNSSNASYHSQVQGYGNSQEDYFGNEKYYGEEEYPRQMYENALDGESGFTAHGFQSKYSMGNGGTGYSTRNGGTGYSTRNGGTGYSTGNGGTGYSTRNGGTGYSLGNGGTGRIHPVGFQTTFNSGNGSEIFANDNVSMVPRKNFALESLANGNKAKTQNEVPFAGETCPICPAFLKSKITATAHFIGKPHENKVRWYLANLWDRPLPPPVVNMTSSSRCDLCKVDCASLSIAMAHYEGKPHAKKVRAYCEGKGLGVPQRKQLSQMVKDNDGGVANGKNKMVKDNDGGVANGKKKDSKFQCKLCDVTVGCQITLNMHLKGSKHKQKLISRVK